MKIKQLSLLLSLVVSSANAASITVATSDSSNVPGGTARSIHITDGTAIANGSGFVALGYFSTLTSFGTSNAAAIETDFNQLGTSGTVSGVDVGGTPIDGLFSFSPLSANIPGGSPFINQEIILVIGNGTSIGNSSELLILESTTQFAEDNPTFFATLDLQTGTGLSVLYGANNYDASSDVIVNFGGTDYFGATNSYQMAAVIPEPSAALIGGFGALLLLRRRRND